jgi:hypothetical protein
VDATPLDYIAIPCGIAAHSLRNHEQDYGLIAQVIDFDFCHGQKFSILHGVQGRGANMATNLHLAPRFKMCGVLPPASRTSSWHDNQAQGQCSHSVGY